ncbi:unnamed protein product [Cyprideis torosa]|uniref:Uncharacterized protein n=1 Tax=Cyprideis torosa TaxID=163714 RepID=A0A7R8ZK00_9CRUS|nr:unnamed protein product [Cyprideis torosa]CAG0880688.1 unnamed protein product [Cyprideis torosa]
MEKSIACDCSRCGCVHVSFVCASCCLSPSDGESSPLVGRQTSWRRRRRSAWSSWATPIPLSFFLLLVASCGSFSAAWEDQLMPIVQFSLAEEVQGFLGNESSVDHFKLLSRDGERNLLIGARNMIYNISLPDLNEVGRIHWYSTSEDIQTCRFKGRTPEECMNYIRVLIQKPGVEEGQRRKLLVCGTNSYKPLCREYTQNSEGNFDEAPPFDGRGLCPFNPKHNSTATFVDGQFYVATEVDFSSTESMIYRDPLRTEQYDLLHLNMPD